MKYLLNAAWMAVCSVHSPTLLVNTALSPMGCECQHRLNRGLSSTISPIILITTTRFPNIYIYISLIKIKEKSMMTLLLKYDKYSNKIATYIPIFQWHFHVWSYFEYTHCNVQIVLMLNFWRANVLWPSNVCSANTPTPTHQLHSPYQSGICLAPQGLYM